MKMKNDDGTWTEEAKRSVWEKAFVADRRDPDNSRLDVCHARMHWKDYGNRDSNYGWEIDHVLPESFLKEKEVPQELIDNLDNLRPMHWKNNLRKGDDFPSYSANTSAAGMVNIDDVYRDYNVNRDQINILRVLFKNYLNISHPTTLGQWQVMTDRDVSSTWDIPAPFFDEISTQSVYDIQ